MKFQAIACLLVLCLCASANATFVNGSVRASSGSFSKILKATRLVLVKFDDVFPYGEKLDEYKKIAEASKQYADWLCVDIGVADYGDKDNQELAERYSVKRDDFPAYFLFKNGDAENPIRFKGSFKADEVKAFVAREGGLYIGLTGCIEALDKLATRFVSESNVEKRNELVSETKAEAAKASAEEKENADFYVKVMEKSLEKASFVVDEMARISKLKDGKVSDTKRAQMNTRLNILTVFKNASLKPKDEL